VHAQHVQGQVGVGDLVDGSQAQQGGSDRDMGLAGQLAQLLGGAGENHSAADIKHRALGGVDGLGGHSDLPGVTLAARPIAGQVHLAVAVFDQPDLHVLGQIDEHGARPARAGNVIRLAHDAR